VPRDVTTLCSLLRSGIPNGASITAVTTLSHGHSNETYLVHGLNQILRLPPFEAPLLGQSGIHGVVKQYAILVELRGLGSKLPIPAPLFIDREGSILGDPFYLMENLPGEAWGDWGAPDWVTSGSVTQNSGISEQVLDAYAVLHHHPPLDSLQPISTALAELNRWRAPIERFADRALLEAFDRLAETLPSEQAPAPCHGDAKLANMLWHAGHLTGVLDWEMAFNGDPRWDLANFLSFFDSPWDAGLPGSNCPGLWQRDRIIDEWESKTGRCASGIDWFEAARKTRAASIMGYGLWLWQTGRSSDARFGTWSSVVKKRGEKALEMATKLATRV
jgi:aminoglycoside phosphotransferase (APT) family kinase protein